MLNREVSLSGGSRRLFEPRGKGPKAGGLFPNPAKLPRWVCPAATSNLNLVFLKKQVMQSELCRDMQRYLREETKVI